MILFANTFVFCDIIYKLCKIRKQKVKVGVDKKDYSRTEIMDRSVLDRLLCIRDTLYNGICNILKNFSTNSLTNDIGALYT